MSAMIIALVLVGLAVVLWRIVIRLVVIVILFLIVLGVTHVAQVLEHTPAQQPASSSAVGTSV